MKDRRHDLHRKTFFKSPFGSVVQRVENWTETGGLGFWAFITILLCDSGLQFLHKIKGSTENSAFY